MREPTSNSPSTGRNLTLIALATALVLLVPLMAMQFTEEVVWSAGDFVAAGVLLFGAGATYELLWRNGGTMAYRAGAGLAVITALFLVWVNLAVGVIGDEEHDGNLMYLAVLATGIVGAAVARLRPQGMARAMFATALVHAIAGVIAAIAWFAFNTLALNIFFVAVWAASGWLFLRAAERDGDRAAADGSRYGWRSTQ
jgi:hypothetical protein